MATGERGLPPLRNGGLVLFCVSRSLLTRVHRGLLAVGRHRLAHVERQPPPPRGPPRAELRARLHRHLSLPGESGSTSCFF